MRLTAKPGLFFAVIATLPTRFAKASALAWVSSDVCRPRINSNSAISGTGLKKWMPMKRSGWSAGAARFAIRPVGRGGKFRHRDRGRIGGQQRLRPQRCAEILQDLDLQILILGRRLDD